MFFSLTKKAKQINAWPFALSFKLLL